MRVLRVVRRNPQFARLWCSQVISQSGDWLNRMACLTLIGTLGGKVEATRLGTLFGLELALRLLPSAVLGPLAGPVADRLPRRLLMVLADLSRAAVVAGMYFVRDPGDLALLYVLIGAQMGIGIFFDAARTAAMPDTVGREELTDAYALSSATWSLMLGIGALAGGWLVKWFGLREVFLIDAVSYVASALCLHGLRLPPVPKQVHAFRWRDVALLTDLRRGLEHARGLGIAPILWAKTFWGAAGGYLVVLSLAGHERFGESSGADAVGQAAVATGVLYAARGLGTGLGPILGRRFLGESDRALRRQISLGFLVAALGYALFGFAHDLRLAAMCVGVAHLGGASLWIASTVFWQRRVDDAYRGRVFAVEFLGMDLAFAAGGLLAGWIFDRTGSLSITVWTVSALVLGLGSAWTWLARGVRGTSEKEAPS